MSLVLYKADASPPSWAAMMMVEILGLKERFKMYDLNPVAREQDALEYFKKNPMRTIPILDEGDFCLADSHAIMIYLLEKYGGPEHSHLYPTDKRKRATVHQRLFFDCGILFPRLRSVMGPTYVGRLSEMSKNMGKNIEDAYRTLEAYLAETRFMADDVITIADISIITTMSSLHGLHPVDENRFPKLSQWFKNMSEQEYVKKISKPGSELHVWHLKELMEINKQNKKSKL